MSRRTTLTSAPLLSYSAKPRRAAPDGDELPARGVERDQRELAVVVELREAREHAGRELRHVLHEALVSRLLRKAVEEEPLERGGLGAHRAHRDAPAVAQRDAALELRRVGMYP